MRRLTLLALLATLPTTLLAQRVPVVARPQLRCAAYDSLMMGVDKSDPGMASMQGRGPSRFINVQGVEAIGDQERGIGGVDFTVMADSGVTIERTSLQVMVHLTEPLERPISERQGILLLDDTLTIDLGSLAQTPGATFPNGVKTWYLYGPAPRGSLLALARAQKIEIKAGSTRWEFPTKLRQNLRGALAALVCQR